MTDAREDTWTIAGAEGEPILGVTDHPEGSPRGVAIIAHGFKGYLDYGMFPTVAAACRDAGWIAHRFNFSHSGMTREIATFARPELFRRDTWNRQAFDLGAVAAAIDGGRLAGAGLPRVLFGHSRGGATCLLTAGRRAGETAGWTAPSGIVTAAAPSGLCSLNDAQRAELLERGTIPSPSSRTGQVLEVGRAYLQEQLDDPAGHDLLALVAQIACPMLVIHGDEDATVPVSCAAEIEAAATAPTRRLIIKGGNHVFNTPNPMPPDGENSPELAALVDGLVGFLESATEGHRATSPPRV